MTRSSTIVVVGAGAAGLMAGIHAARMGARVLVLDGMKGGGRKILISGGGRCNVLPSVHAPQRFITSSSKHSMRHMLGNWSLGDQRHFFEHDLHIPLRLEEETGKLFPASNLAKDVRDALWQAFREAGGDLRSGRVLAITTPTGDDMWGLDVEGHGRVEADAVILATGGLSVPKTGSDGWGMQMVTKLGHTINPTYPALTPLLGSQHSHLSGVSLKVSVRGSGNGGRMQADGGFLFTHRGYSGPAILDISHIVTQGAISTTPNLTVQWAPLDDNAWAATLVRSKTMVLTAIRQHVPARLADQLLREADIPVSRTLSQLKRGERTRLVQRLAAYPLKIEGHAGFQKAEVTGGGVALAEVDPRTLESRLHPGLFLCGEMLDAFGPIGGFNFQWAWSTGRAAGLGAAARMKGEMTG